MPSFNTYIYCNKKKKNKWYDSKCATINGSSVVCVHVIHNIAPVAINFKTIKVPLTESDHRSTAECDTH